MAEGAGVGVSAQCRKAPQIVRCPRYRLALSRARRGVRAQDRDAGQTDQMSQAHAGTFRRVAFVIDRFRFEGLSIRLLTTEITASRGSTDVRRSGWVTAAPRVGLPRFSGSAQTSGFLRLGNVPVALESLMLQNHSFDGDFVDVRVEFGQGLVLGYPAPAGHVTQHDGALLIEQIDP